MKRVLLNLVLLFGIIVVIAGSACFLYAEKDHPKDRDLLEFFSENRHDFDALIAMFKADRSLGRIGSNFERTSSFFGECKGDKVWNGDKIEVTKERLSDYRSLFTKLKLPAGIEGYCDKHEIYLYASTKGLSITGSTKGYAFLDERPKVLVDDLDTYWSADGKSFIAYRHIEGNWYLFFDYED